MTAVALAWLLLAAMAAPAAAGEVTGRVVFRGEIPTLPSLPVIKDQQVCGEQMAPEALIVSPTNRGVQHAIVYLEGVAPVESGPAPGEVTLENRGCRFVPHVLAIRVGTELAIANADPVLHNLRAWSPERRAVLNVVQPTQGQITRRTIKRPGVLSLTCDTHVHMQGFILAFEHPYFAATDVSGAFRITGVPPGTYRLTAWHEGWTILRREPEGRPVWAPARVLTRELVVPATGEVRVLFEFSAAP